MSTLISAYLRRSRWRLLAWVLGVGLLPALMVVSTRVGYPTQADLDAFVRESMASVAQVAIRGPIFEASVGGIVAWTLASSGSLVGCVIAMIFVVSYARADEQAGRLELELAGRATRREQLLAAVFVVGGASVLTGLVAVVGLLATGMDPAGSVLLGLVLASAMLFFTAVGAVCAQVAADSGAAGGLGAIAIGASVVLAAIGDATGSPLVWVSPFGWARHAQAFAGDRFWAPLIPLVLAVVLAWIALRLNAARDYGTGAIPARPGRATAPAWVRSPLTLALRLQRGAVIGWTVALTLLGVLLGSVLAGLDQQLAGSAFEDFAHWHGGTVGEVFFQFVLYLLAQIAAMAALVAVLALRRDEAGGLAEPVLARAVTRRRWSVAGWTVAVMTSVAILLGVGVGAALGSGRWSLPLTTVAYLPATLVVVGLALALTGWLPRAAVAVSWAALGLLILLDLLAEFNLVSPQVVGRVSPFAATFSALFTGGLPVTLAVLTAIGLGLAAFGLVGIRRRDLRPS
ncbi:ABC transporter permease [Tessaracoccus caeni]|uniref:ABC transporter permease n=1 Tax=Tessaracoccus caeni TaxID=3031239 RepID=UPI0023D9C529|nr:hypothetical protein [Tessaracoccus caeni]MDF1487171.1 hypothetical protein [Tessaracoccus caeni]